METYQATDIKTISVRATLGLKSNNGRNLTRKTFSFRGFEQEDLAHRFVQQLDAYLHGFISTCSESVALTTEELFLVRPIGSTKGCCRTADISLHATYDFEMLLDEMLKHFDTSSKQLMVSDLSQA